MTDTGRPHDDAADETPLSPEASATLIRQQRREVNRRLELPVPLVFGAWGIAWTLSYSLIYLANGGAPGPKVSGWLAGIATAVLFATAMAISVVAGRRAGRGIRGPSQQAGMLYGYSFAASFTALSIMTGGFVLHGAGDDFITLLWSGLLPLLFGAITMAGSALFRTRAQYVLGVWMLVAGIAAVYAGVPGNYLVLALAGGGGLLGLAAWVARQPDGTWQGPGRPDDPRQPDTTPGRSP